MTKQLHIVKERGIPVDLATQSTALIARKGQGKTYTASVMAEEFLDHDIQVVVIATVGNWYGLRLGADGKSKGYDVVVLGGLRGDVPLTSTSGALVADLVISTGRSFIIDVSQFSKADRIRFCTDFAERLWSLKKAELSPAPLHVFLEEAQLLVPQRIEPATARMYGVLEEIVRLGRNYGIGVTLISQRPQSVNKEVLSQTEVLFTFQVAGSQDRKAIRDWIVANSGDENLLEDLATLQPGEAFLWSPSWLQWFGRVHVRARKTYDASATPKVGEKRPERALAPLDLEEVKKAMATVEAEAERRDPTALQRRVAQLERELAQARAAKPAPAKVERREVPVLKDGQLLRAENLVQQLREATQPMIAALDAVRAAANAPRREDVIKVGPVSIDCRPARERVPLRPLRAASAAPGDFNLTARLREILETVAAYTRDQPTIEVKRLAALVGMKVAGGFNNYLGSLNTAGMIERAHGSIGITEAGLAAIGGRPPAESSTEEILTKWRPKLPGKAMHLLEHLVQVYPATMTVEQAAEFVDMAVAGGFNNYLGMMNTRGLITRQRGVVAASPSLFPSAEAAHG